MLGKLYLFLNTLILVEQAGIMQSMHALPSPFPGPHHHYPVHHFLAQVDPVVSSGMDEQGRGHANYR